MKEDSEVTNRLKVIAKNFAPLAYINKRNDEMALYPFSSSDEEEIDDFGRKVKVKKKKNRGKQSNQSNAYRDEEDKVGESIMMDDPNKLDIINHVTSMKLLAISEAFDHFPKG